VKNISKSEPGGYVNTFDENDERNMLPVGRRTRAKDICVGCADNSGISWVSILGWLLPTCSYPVKENENGLLPINVDIFSP